MICYVFVAGKPIDNCIIYLVNKDMQLIPQGEVGELIVAGRNLAAGYIRGRDTHKFLDNPYAVDPGEKIKLRNKKIECRVFRT